MLNRPLSPTTPPLKHRDHAFCVIGAGPSGLLAARALKLAQLDYDHFEQYPDVGGVWNRANPIDPTVGHVKTKIAKRKAGLPAFPIPAAFPDYLERPHMAGYLKDFAKAYGLYDRIAFNRSVSVLEPEPDDQHWRVHLNQGEVVRYRGVFICHGRHETPHIPTYPGVFEGPALHASECRNLNYFRDKRVLIVGEGQEACDLACAAVTRANKTILSSKYGFHILPETLFGRPARSLTRLRNLPSGLRRLVLDGLVRFAGQQAAPGLSTRMGLDLEPVFHARLPEFLERGLISIKPDVEQLTGGGVRFRDGSTKEIDLIVFATGFDPVFPFMDHDQFDWISGYPDLFLNAIHREYDNLCVLGCHLTEGNAYAHYDRQAAMMCHFILAQDRRPHEAEAFRRIKRESYPDLCGGALAGFPGYGIFARNHRFDRYWRRTMRQMGWPEKDVAVNGLHPNSLDPIVLMD